MCAGGGSVRREAAALLWVLVLAAAGGGSVVCEAQLRRGYYAGVCPNVESIVRGVVAKKIQQTPATVGATVRLFFHDCFVEVRLRRVGDGGVDGEQHGGERPPHQPVPGRRRLRHGDQSQGGRGRRAGVPRQGVVRRHPRHGHQGRHRAVGRSVVRGGAGSAGRAEVDGEQRQREAAGALLQPGPAQPDVRRQRALADRHGRPLSWAHGGSGALQHVRGAAAGGGRDAGRRVRGAAGGVVPGGGGSAGGGGHGPRDAGELRQPVLPEPAGREGTAGVGPGAAHGHQVQTHRRRAGTESRRVRQSLRRRHHQAGPRRGQDGDGTGQRPPRLRRARLRIELFLVRMPSSTSALLRYTRRSDSSDMGKKKENRRKWRIVGMYSRLM